MKNYTKYILYISFFILTACDKNSKSDIQIKILNKELYTYTSKTKKDTLNILNIEVINNSNEIYYFNDIINTDSLSVKGLYKNGVVMKIFNEKKDKEIGYNNLLPSDFGPNMSFNDSISQDWNLEIINLELERLNAKNNFKYFTTKNSNNNFYIHPKEKIYIDLYLSLKNILPHEHNRVKVADLSLTDKYYAKIYFASDSANYKSELPANVFKTIKENNIKVFHGTIVSKNKVPIKILE